MGASAVAIAHIAKTVFGMSAPDLEELIYWADIIDGAQFESPQAAVELKEPRPAMRERTGGAHRQRRMTGACVDEDVAA